MPSVQLATSFIADVTRLEARAAQGAVTTWQTQRAALLLALSGLPGSTIERIENTIADAARALDMSTQEYAVALGAAVDGFARMQAPGELANIGVVDLRSPLRAWQASTYGLMLSELSRLRSTGANEAQIIARLITGRDGRQSAFDRATTSLQLTVEQSIWNAANGRANQRYLQIERRDGERYQRQAIAAIDRRTTACCLRVHGQIVDLDQPFHLTGTPRFAEYVSAPPFHYRCRTAITLYKAAFEAVGTTTEEMRARARAEFARR